MALKSLAGGSLKNISLGSPLVESGENSLEKETIFGYMRRTFDDDDWEKVEEPDDGSAEGKNKISCSPLLGEPLELLDDFWEEKEAGIGNKETDKSHPSDKEKEENSCGPRKAKRIKKGASNLNKKSFQKATGPKAQINFHDFTRSLGRKILLKAKARRMRRKSTNPISLFVGKINISQFNVNIFPPERKKRSKGQSTGGKKSTEEAN